MSDLRIYTTTENKGKFYTNLPSHDVYNESPIQRRGGGRHEHRYHPLSTPANILGPGRNRCSLQRLSRSVRDIIDIPFSYRVINHFPSVTDTPPSVTVKSRNVDKPCIKIFVYNQPDIPLFPGSRNYFRNNVEEESYLSLLENWNNFIIRRVYLTVSQW